MRRRRRIARLVTRAMATALVGGLLGFLVPTIAADLSPRPVTEPQVVVPESPLAREFIDAYTTDDQAVLTAIGAPAALRLRASDLRAAYAEVGTPVHLGSYVAGGFTLHAYAAHVVRADGSEDTLSWRLGTSGGGVVLFTLPGTADVP